MNNLWTIYDELSRAMNILGQSPRFAPDEILNDAIDKAFGILYKFLPEMEEALTQMEEQK